jgi:hypothetical protein
MTTTAVFSLITSAKSPISTRRHETRNLVLSALFETPIAPVPSDIRDYVLGEGDGCS